MSSTARSASAPGSPVAAAVETLARAFDACPAALLVQDDAGRVVYGNLAFEQLTGTPTSDALGRLLPDVVALAARDDSTDFPRREWASFRDGPVIPVETSRWSVPNLAGTLHCLLLQDARPHVAYQATQLRVVDSLRRQARSDHLTGLANRFELEERLSSAHLVAGDVAVVVVDLDGFKPVNDRHGHVVGDEVLIEVGLRLLSVRRPEWTVARVGGDEFVVLARLEGGDSLDGVLARVRASLAGPVRTSVGDLVVAASVGGAAGPAAEARTLVRRADKAMYVTKISRAVQREIDEGEALLPGRERPRDRRLGDRRTAGRRSQDAGRQTA